MSVCACVSEHLGFVFKEAPQSTAVQCRRTFPNPELHYVTHNAMLGGYLSVGAEVKTRGRQLAVSLFLKSL